MDPTYKLCEDVCVCVCVCVLRTCMCSTKILSPQFVDVHLRLQVTHSYTHVFTKLYIWGTSMYPLFTLVDEASQEGNSGSHEENRIKAIIVLIFSIS